MSAAAPSSAPPAPASAAASAAVAGSLLSLEKVIEKTIETLWVGSVLVEDGQPNAPKQLHGNIETLMAQLQSIDAEARRLPASVRVPIGLIETVDGGGNPDQLLRTELLAAAQKNDDTRHKWAATERLRTALVERLQYFDQHSTSTAATAAATAAAAAAAANSLPPLPPIPTGMGAASMHVDTKFKA